MNAVRDSKEPSVFQYLDAHQFLQDYCGFLRTRDKDFSYESWSHKIGFHRSRAFVRLMVIGKKKISANFTEIFVSKCLANEGEREYFRVLVSYTNAADADEKRLYGDQLVRLLRRLPRYQPIENPDMFLSQPMLPRLLTLLSFQDLDRGLVNLAKLMKKDPLEIQQALSKLSELGLAESQHTDQGEQWISLNPNFEVPSNKGSMNLLKFHEQSLQEAVQAFDQPKELRQYKAVLLPMSPEEIKNFSKFLDDFVSEQYVRYSSDSFAGKRVFQFNFNYYAVTGEGK